MRGRPSIGFELSADELENLVFPQAVENRLKQLGVSAWDERNSTWKQTGRKGDFYL